MIKPKRIALIGGLLLAGGMVAAGCAHFMNSGEKEIALEKTPSPVQSSINKVLAGQKADKIVVENEDGKTIYEVTYHLNGQEHSADFTPAGEIIEEEADLDVASLPAAVSGAIQKKYPGAKIEEAAEVSAGGQKYFETGIKLSSGAERELQVNSDGTIRADKQEDEKDEKKGK